MKITKNKIVYEEDINKQKGKALAIVFPDSGQEIKNLVKLSEVDIIPRAGGSSFTSAVYPNNSVIIDFSKMNKMLDLNLNKKTAVVEPGIIINELNEYLEEHGLEFPIIPIFSGIETIGGLIAKNSSGASELKYGRMLNWLESLEVINGKSEQIKISKSDLSDFVGMEGTTGAILKATIRLTTKKQKSLTILKSSDINFILDANKKLRLESEVCSIDILSKQASQFLGFENKYHLFVEYESEKGLFKKADYEKYMKLKTKAYNKIAEQGFHNMENVRVYADSIEDFMIYLEENNIPYFGHLGTGVFYICFHPIQKDKQQEALNMARKLRATISYNFGFGLKNKEFVLPSDKMLMNRVKARHDPQNKFNLNKLIDKKEYGKENKEEIEAKINVKEIKKEIEQEENEIEEIDELIEKQVQDEKVENINPETMTLKKEERELTEEERDKVKKIAFGFFGNKKPQEKEEDKNKQDSSGGYIG